MKRNIASTLILLTLGLNAAESKLELRHREANGVGYNKGYSTVDYLFSHQWEKPEFLFNLRGHLFNDGRFAGNIGIGYRHGFKDDSYMCGVNVFYDCRESKHLFTNQAGAGLEFLTKHLDLRMNGYLPFGETKAFEKKKFERFSGNQIIIKQRGTGALPSAEMELGSPLTRYLYLAAGPYYLFKQDVRGMHLGNSWGGKVRLTVDISRYFTLGGLVTYDRIFNTTVQGYLSFKIPLGGKWEKQPAIRNLRKVPICRNEIIPLERKKRHTALYVGEEERETVDILFVNNMALKGGNGSIEAPFSSLKEAEAASDAGDIIYVFPGDKTPRNMEEGIVLQKNQQIASAGAPLQIENLIIPPMTPGQNPVITNIHPGQPVVANPGNSHLEDFRIIQPWEYFFGNWDSYQGDRSASSESYGFSASEGIDIESPLSDSVVIVGPVDNLSDFSSIGFEENNSDSANSSFDNISLGSEDGHAVGVPGDSVISENYVGGDSESFSSFEDIHQDAASDGSNFSFSDIDADEL